VDRKNQFVLVGLIRGHFERLHSLMGFEEALMALLTDTDEVAEYFKAFTEYRLKMIDQIAEYYKPDSIMLNDDYASAEGMLMDPELWRRILKPEIRRMIDRIHEHGIYCTMHCCGKMEPIFADYVEMKTDALHPVQAMNDVKGLKRNTENKSRLSAVWTIRAFSSSRM
jgi:uroporphyrinogen decarboxylase